MSEKGKKHPAPEEAIASEQPASAAERALREAAERRRASKSTDKSKAHEIGGRKLGDHVGRLAAVGDYPVYANVLPQMLTKGVYAGEQVNNRIQGIDSRLGGGGGVRCFAVEDVAVANHGQAPAFG